VRHFGRHKSKTPVANERKSGGISAVRGHEANAKEILLKRNIRFDKLLTIFSTNLNIGAPMKLKSLFATSLIVPTLLLAEDTTAQTEIEKEVTQTTSEEQSLGYWNSYPATYYSVHVHQLAAVSPWGDTVEIEDGSVWQVHPSHAYKVLGWLTSDSLTITQNTSWFSRYNYRIINKRTNQSVEVNLSLGPLTNGPYTRYIVAADLDRKEIMLNDNTHWAISWFDTSTFNKWALNDAIIIGINSGFDHKCESILINVTNNDSLRAHQF